MIRRILPARSKIDAPPAVPRNLSRFSIPIHPSIHPFQFASRNTSVRTIQTTQRSNISKVALREAPCAAEKHSQSFRCQPQPRVSSDKPSVGDFYREGSARDPGVRCRSHSARPERSHHLASSLDVCWAPEIPLRSGCRREGSKRGLGDRGAR